MWLSRISLKKRVIAILLQDGRSLHNWAPGRKAIFFCTAASIHVVSGERDPPSLLWGSPLQELRPAAGPSGQHRMSSLPPNQWKSWLTALTATADCELQPNRPIKAVVRTGSPAPQSSPTLQMEQLTSQAVEINMEEGPAHSPPPAPSPPTSAPAPPAPPAPHIQVLIPLMCSPPMASLPSQITSSSPGSPTAGDWPPLPPALPLPAWPHFLHRAGAGGCQGECAEPAGAWTGPGSRRRAGAEWESRGR